MKIEKMIIDYVCEKTNTNSKDFKVIDESDLYEPAWDCIFYKGIFVDCFSINVEIDEIIDRTIEVKRKAKTYDDMSLKEVLEKIKSDNFPYFGEDSADDFSYEKWDITVEDYINDNEDVRITIKRDNMSESIIIKGEDINKAIDERK